MIKRKSLFKTDHPLRDQSIAVNARQALFYKSQREHADKIDEKYDRLSIATEGYRTGVDLRTDRTRFERQYQQALNRLLIKGREAIFKNIFSDIVIEALSGDIIDENIIKEKELEIRSVVEAYIDEEGGYEFLVKALETNNIPILRGIKEACDTMAKKVTNRKRKEIEESSGIIDPDLIDFSLTDEEKKELDYTKRELSIPEISELVKNKVLTVVKDEKQRAKEQQEMQNAIEREVKDELGDNATNESFQQALESRIIHKPVRETSTLYDSIFRNTFKNVVLEKSGAISYEEEEDYDEDRQDIHPLPEDDLNLDLILAESLLQYTILESAYTIRLVDYDYRQLEKLSETLLN